MEPNYTTTTPEGVTVKVWYENALADTVDIASLLRHLFVLKKNLSVLGVDILKGMTLEIWNTKNPTCPRSDDKVRRIDTVAGLAYSWLNKIQLNSAYCGAKDLPVVLSHEVGHLVAAKVGFDDLSSLFRKNWNKIRGVDVTPDTPAGEMFAEDIMSMLGAEGAEGLVRTDKYRYVSASSIPAMEQMYTILALLQLKGVDASVSLNWNKGKVVEVFWTEGNPVWPWTFKVKKANTQGLWTWNLFTLGWQRS